MFRPAFTPLFPEGSYMYPCPSLAVSSCPFPYWFQSFQLPQILLSASSARQDHHNFLGIQLSVSWLENDCQAEDCVITGSFRDCLFCQGSQSCTACCPLPQTVVLCILKLFMVGGLVLYQLLHHGQKQKVDFLIPKVIYFLITKLMQALYNNIKIIKNYRI